MATCKICKEPLVVELESDDEHEDGDDAMGETQTVPDDLELSCGCHFHWQCLLDTSPTTSLTLSCPSCGTYLPQNAPGPSATNPFLQTPHQAAQTRIPAIYTNEGGVQPDLDLLPRITEEAFLAAHPSARPARAMHILCAAGDAPGIVELWQDVSESNSDGAAAAEDGHAMTVPQLLRWQDPLSDNQSALHVAVAADQEEVAYLLLWAGSALDAALFPPAAREAIVAAGLGERPVVPKGEDIRALRDSGGRTAGDQAAARMGHVWGPLVEKGYLMFHNRGEKYKCAVFWTD